MRFPYDKLVLATGSYPFVPPIKGSERKECLTYRTIDDLAEIKAGAKVQGIVKSISQIDAKHKDEI